MPTPREEAVRDAVLDLTLASHRTNLTHEAVAERTGLTVEDLRAQWPDLESLISFTLRPLSEAIDDLLRRLPIHKSPSPADQREVLDALLTASLAYPRHEALVVRILTSERSDMTTRADHVAYQAGVRLLGVNYDSDPDLMTRVYFVSELIALTVATHRHDYTHPRTRELLIESLLAILNPQQASPRPPHLRRRWTDQGRSTLAPDTSVATEA